MNKTIISGHLGRDAEVKEFDNGSVVNFPVAVTKKGYTTRDGKVIDDKTTWFDCAYWRSANVAQYLKKGTKVLLEGEIESRAWIKDNQAYSALVLRVNDLEFMSSAQSNDSQPAQSEQPKSVSEANGEDNLPF